MPFSPPRLAITLSAFALIGSAEAHAPPPPAPPPGWIWQGVWQDGQWSGQWIPPQSQPAPGAYVPPAAPMAYAPMPYAPMPYGTAGYAPPAPVVETKTVTTTEYIDVPARHAKPRRAAPHKDKRVYTGS